MLPRTLFSRGACVDCPDTNPQCPSCDPGSSCALLAQTCETCAKAVCQKDQEISSPSNSNSKAGNSGGGGSSPTGAIVGGVVGGMIVICLIGYLLYRLYKKRRDQQYEFEASMASSSEYGPEKHDSYGNLKDARNSTHTMHSIASTCLTRASNVIQIAYIPGVTNISNPNSPGSLVPPVPPLPLNSPSYASATPTGEQQYFSAGDILRNSTYSAVSTIPDRSSVATTIYRNNAIVSPVAATAVRAKAAVVTVKGASASTSQASSPGLAPPVPQIDFSAYEVNAAAPSSPAFSVGSTFLNKKSSNESPLRSPEIVEGIQVAQVATATYLTPAAKKRVSKGAMVAPREEDGPFSDRASLELTQLNKRGSTANSVHSSSQGRASPATFKEGDIRISLRPMSITDETPERPQSSDRSRSPFADDNKVNEDKA